LIFGGRARVDAIAAMCRSLQAGASEIHVVSRNSSFVVKKALATVGLTYVTSVIGDEELQESDRSDTPKSVLIKRRLVGEEGLVNGAELLFVDDDVNNVKDVRAAIPGSKCIHVKGKGMDDKDIAAVMQWLAGESSPEKVSEVAQLQAAADLAADYSAPYY